MAKPALGVDALTISLKVGPHRAENFRAAGRSDNPRGALCFEMGFNAEIFWELRCNIEINVLAHFWLVFEVPYRPRVKGMPGKS